ncbi:MAG: branched-chain amino acid ABC transporter permease [Pseudomonadota bacterium]
MQRHIPLTLYLALCALITAAFQFNWISAYLQTVLMFIGINIMLCSSLNLVNGYMGEFSCGHGGFMAVGAYVASILNVWLFTTNDIFGEALLDPKMSVFLVPVTLFIGGVAAAITGLLVAIPSFRTRGDYLAVITLAVTYIIKSTLENIQTIGGARGFMGMRKVVDATSELANLPWLAIWILAFVGLTIWVLHRLVTSTYGKGISAMRDDEIAAEVMGVNTKKMKLVGFLVSSGIAGIAGGLFAHVLGYINPGSFSVMKSTEVMVMVYLGGVASLSGSVISAISFTLLMELLRPLQVFKWILIPLLLIILMIFRPEGIMGNRELTDLFPKIRRLFPRRKM